MSIRLPFGLKDNKLLSVQEVASGLACGCYCPGCGQPLVARKGKQKLHHFAHYQEAACEHGLESILHWKAKDFFSKSTFLVLPACYLRNWGAPIFPAQRLAYSTAKIEYHLNPIKPDILLYAGQKPKLLVEIAVSHPADSEKIKQIRRLGIPALEIDVAHLLPDMQTRDFPEMALRDSLLKDTTHKKWLYHPAREKLEGWLRQQAQAKPVKHIQLKNNHIHSVSPCPANKRMWKNAWQTPSSYAFVLQDCLHCPFCSEIQYEQEWRGGRLIPTLPKTVLCWAERWGEVREQWRGLTQLDHPIFP